MNNGRLNNRDRLFIRLGKDGIAVADSAIWRKMIPRGGSGRWKDITEAVMTCCSLTTPDQGIYIIIKSTSATGIKSITFPGYTFTPTVAMATGGYLVIELPANMAEAITFTTSAASGTFTATTVQGTGVAPTMGAVTAVTTTAIFPTTPGSTYLVSFT